MLQVENLSFSFPQKDLFENISFEISSDDHCAFIGVSGSGKSTIVEMIRDEDRYLFDGKIVIDDHCRIGFINQFTDFDQHKDQSVFSYIASYYYKIQSEIEKLCEAMASSEDIEPLLEAYQISLDQLDAIGGEDFESIIHKKLYMAGLSEQQHLPLSSLSGGELKLVEIIKEMMNRPELIIMDEPDVFLDFNNLIALKQLINSYKGALIIITHNRYLLNHCFNKILHLENKKINCFEGNYITYNFELLKDKIEAQEQALKDEAEIERNEMLINRLRKIATYNSEAARGKSLRARVKIQERLEARRVAPPFVAIKQPNINLSTDSQKDENNASNTPTLSIDDFSFAYDSPLLENISFAIHPNEKVALIGANGTGKTTLMREIFKSQHPAIKRPAASTLAYLSQNQQETFSSDLTVLDTFMDAGLETLDSVLNAIRGYGFTESILEQKIAALSGGEKTLLQLAYVATQKADMLLLDEPTSHLDTYAQAALENAVKSYEGSVLLISHDYYTIANCVDYVLLLEDKNIRKLSNRKFRKMIYNDHFSKDYLSLDEKKKALEFRIEKALKKQDFETALKISEELEPLIKALS